MSKVLDRFVTYNGRRYQLLWAGQTKYGNRANLRFLDGSKSFWVDAAKCEAASVGRRRGVEKQCWECGCGYSGSECPVCGEEER
jgi:hypothetical protein